MNTKMLTTGAYSKKYQQIERDKVQHLRDREKRTNRERALLLSKQTAQRQKALEEKKRAMAVAEEQRRRKALEDRRKAQLEATARFRSAMSRVKSNPRAKYKPMDNIEIYLPDKAKANNPKNSSSALKVQQRVAYGREVEVKHTSDDSGAHTSLQKRTPSLDDVLNQIRGIDQSSSVADGHLSSVSSHPKPHPHGHINVHHHHHHSSAVIASSTSSQQVPGAAAGSTVNYTEATKSTPLLRGRSASDSNLSTLAVHHTSPVKAQQSLNGTHKDAPDAGVVESDRLRLIEVESEVASSTGDELMFKPVTSNMRRGNGHYRSYTTATPPSLSAATRTVQSDDGTRVVSPESAESSSSSDRSFSPPPSSLNDSLEQPPPVYVVDSGIAKKVKASRHQHDDSHAGRRRVKLTSSHKKSDSRESSKSGQSSAAASLKVLGVPAGGAPRPPTPATPPLTLVTSQPIYGCQDSDSSNSSSDGDTDSLNEEGSYSRSRRVAPHRSKKHNQQPTKATVEATNHEDSSNISERKDGPKVETQGQSSSSAATTTAEMPAGTNSKPKIVGILKKTSSSNIESSQSVSSMHMERTPSSKANSSSQISTISSAKSQKRVRFVDQVATNNRHKPLHSDSLWNHVLPNGFSTQHLPNSAFTPRMRVLLSSKAPVIPAAVSGPPKRPTGPSNLNGITVHVPFASVESPPSPSPNHPPPEQKKSHQDSDSSDEDTTTDRSDAKPSREYNKNGTSSKNAKFEPTSGNSQNTAKLMEDNSASKSSNGTGDISRVSAPSVSERSLDKTPTDNEINEMWEQIKTCLERDENKQSTSVPVQVFPFQMPNANGMQRHGSASQRENNVTTDTSALSLQREQNQAGGSVVNSTAGHNHQQMGKASEQQSSGPPVRLVHRQSSRNRPMRCQHQPHNQAQLARRHQSHTHHHGHTATYPLANQDQSPQGQGQLVRVYPPVQTSSREPELVVRAMASPINGRIAPTSLSLEEQRLLQSIEKLNQRLKDHLVRPQESVFQPPEPHYPADHFPHHHQATPPRPHPPHNGRSRGHTTDLPKSSSSSNRVHWHQKNTACAATGSNSRTQHMYRTNGFYNT